MKPGATARPLASITRAALALASAPIAAIFPSRRPTSFTNEGLPVPSRMRPLRMSRSNSACWPSTPAIRVHIRANKTRAVFMPAPTPPILLYPNGHPAVGPSGSIQNFVEYCAPNRTPLYRGLKCGDPPTPRVGLRRAVAEWIRAKQRIARNLQLQSEASAIQIDTAGEFGER